MIWGVGDPFNASFVCVQDKTVEISVRLSPKQLDHVAPVLEEIIHEAVEERQKGMLLNGGKYITAHPQHSLGSPVIIQRFRCLQVIVLRLPSSLSVSLSQQLNNLDEDSEG